MTGKEKIVTTALQLFAEEGFENTSIQRLAEVSGVAQGLLYRHFRGKNDLLLHLLHMGFVQISETLLPYRDAELDFQDAYEQHITKCVELLGANYNLWKTLHTVRHNADLMKQLGLTVNFEKEVIQPISDKLAQSKHKDTHTKAWAIVCMIDGVTAMHLMHPGIFPMHKIEKLLKENGYGLFK